MSPAPGQRRRWVLDAIERAHEREFLRAFGEQVSVAREWREFARRHRIGPAEVSRLRSGLNGRPPWSPADRRAAAARAVATVLLLLPVFYATAANLVALAALILGWAGSVADPIFRVSRP